MCYAKAPADRLPGPFCLCWGLSRTFLKIGGESGFWFGVGIWLLTGFL